MNDPAGHILGFPITQFFGGPDQSFSGHHTGMDFATPTGTPLYSIRTGRVTYVSDGSLPPGNINYPQGISVIVESGDERWWYAHLSQLDVTLYDSVGVGQLVGLSGVSGQASGPHLHLERQYRRAPIDPYEELMMFSAEGQAEIEAIVERVVRKYAADIAGGIKAMADDTMPRELRSAMRGFDPLSTVSNNGTMIKAGEQIHPTEARG